MLSLPPLPDSASPTFSTPPPKIPTPPPPRRLSRPPVSEHAIIYQQSAVEPLSIAKKSTEILWQPQPRRTSPMIWLSVILCFVFSITLIFFGVATLIIYLIIQPRNPVFDTPSASLTVIYFDAPEYFNGDFIFIANFSNPNRKIDLRFEYLEIEVFFSDRLIAKQALQPFQQRSGEIRLETVRMILSLVYLPQIHAVELRKQVMSNRVTYEIRGSFKVRASLGLIHYSYWVHGRCQLQMTGPPTGILVARNCTTKR